MQGLVVLLVLLVAAYAAGYFTRDYISRRRREQFRRWENYIDVTPPRASNSNRPERGDLGQMLDRWENRAKARRKG